MVIILDDAVDSFDYKNKYGMIDYLSGLASCNNIQLIIFTHNFDFYRSTILALGKGAVNQYLAYRNSNNEIKFNDSRIHNNYYLEVVQFNSWKHNPTKSQFFALIPFARNIVQLGANVSAVQTFDTYLHYEPIVDNYDINSVLTNVLHPINANICNGFNPNDKYLNKLNEYVESILANPNNVVETDLDVKLSLGLYIRIFLERYLYKTCLNNNIPIPTGNPNAKTMALINAVRTIPNFSNEKEVLNANLIAPAYVHVNSFMYEPIIDVEAETLIKVCDWVHSVNQAWSL